MKKIKNVLGPPNPLLKDPHTLLNPANPLLKPPNHFFLRGETKKKITKTKNVKKKRKYANMQI